MIAQSVYCGFLRIRFTGKPKRRSTAVRIVYMCILTGQSVTQAKKTKLNPNCRAGDNNVIRGRRHDGAVLLNTNTKSL